MQETGTAWERPFTTRRYLQGPASDYLVTTWADAKVVVGEIWGKGDPETPSGAFYFLYGENAGNFDYKKVTYHTHPQGYPIHGQSHEAGDYTFSMESLCNPGLKPTVYTKVTLRSHVPWSVHEKLWIILRTGKETELTGQMDTDGYRTYKPEPTVYGKMPCHYRLDGNVVSDGRFHLVIQSDSLPYSWYDDEDAPYKYQRRLLQIDVDLAPDEEKTFTLSFGTERRCAFDYDREKAACEAFWEKELQRIQVFPEQLKNSPDGFCMYRNFVAHILQLFCKPVHHDYLMPRQGGLQRLIWPVESMPTLEALDTIGDFDDYVERVLSLYFDTLQVKEGDNRGEITNFGENWASVTGACIYSLCVHIMKRDKPELFARYADAAYEAFRWIEKTRALTVGSTQYFNGIFPPMRGCDWGHIFQSWAKTDVLHLDVYRTMIACFERYNDPRTAEIKAAYEDYLAAMKRIFASFEERYADRDELRITSDPSGNDDELPNYPLINDEAYLLTEHVNNRADSMQKIETYLRRRHVFKNGLVGRMRDQSLAALDNKIYYTTIGEFFWYKLWTENGEFEKAHESLLALLKYSTTPEHYMLERYLPENIYYVPWSPNGSANSRTILMLVDWCVRRGRAL